MGVVTRMRSKMFDIGSSLSRMTREDSTYTNYLFLNGVFTNPVLHTGSEYVRGPTTHPGTARTIVHIWLVLPWVSGQPCVVPWHVALSNWRFELIRQHLESPGHFLGHSKFNP